MGPRGFNGSRGLQGPRGYNGSIGPHGIQGQQGIQGPQGIQGVGNVSACIVNEKRTQTRFHDSNKNLQKVQVTYGGRQVCTTQSIRVLQTMQPRKFCQQKIRILNHSFRAGKSCRLFVRRKNTLELFIQSYQETKVNTFVLVPDRQTFQNLNQLQTVKEINIWSVF